MQIWRFKEMTRLFGLLLICQTNHFFALTNLDAHTVISLIDQLDANSASASQINQAAEQILQAAGLSSQADNYNSLLQTFDSAFDSYRYESVINFVGLANSYITNANTVLQACKNNSCTLLQINSVMQDLINLLAAVLLKINKSFLGQTLNGFNLVLVPAPIIGDNQDLGIVNHFVQELAGWLNWAQQVANRPINPTKHSTPVSLMTASQAATNLNLALNNAQAILLNDQVAGLVSIAQATSASAQQQALAQAISKINSDYALISASTSSYMQALSIANSFNTNSAPAVLTQALASAQTLAALPNQLITILNNAINSDPAKHSTPASLMTASQAATSLNLALNNAQAILLNDQVAGLVSIAQATSASAQQQALAQAISKINSDYALISASTSSYMQALSIANSFNTNSAPAVLTQALASAQTLAALPNQLITILNNAINSDPAKHSTPASLMTATQAATNLNLALNNAQAILLNDQVAGLVSIAQASIDGGDTQPVLTKSITQINSDYNAIIASSSSYMQALSLANSFNTSSAPAVLTQALASAQTLLPIITVGSPNQFTITNATGTGVAIVDPKTQQTLLTAAQVLATLPAQIINILNNAVNPVIDHSEVVANSSLSIKIMELLMTKGGIAIESLGAIIAKFIGSCKSRAKSLDNGATLDPVNQPFDQIVQAVSQSGEASELETAVENNDIATLENSELVVKSMILEPYETILGIFTQKELFEQLVQDHAAGETFDDWKTAFFDIADLVNTGMNLSIKETGDSLIKSAAAEGETDVLGNLFKIVEFYAAQSLKIDTNNSHNMETFDGLLGELSSGPPKILLSDALSEAEQFFSLAGQKGFTPDDIVSMFDDQNYLPDDVFDGAYLRQISLLVRAITNPYDPITRPADLTDEAFMAKIKASVLTASNLPATETGGYVVTANGQPEVIGGAGQNIYGAQTFNQLANLQQNQMQQALEKGLEDDDIYLDDLKLEMQALADAWQNATTEQKSLIEEQAEAGANAIRTQDPDYVDPIDAYDD